MSYTTIKALWPGEKHEDLKELSNSHGSAPIVWGELSVRYLGAKDRFSWGTLFGGSTENLWALYKHLGIPEAYRAVLMMTFDYAYVTKKDYKRAAADIRKFLADFPQPSEYVNHWPAIAELFESDPDIPAIGFRCTSVSEDLFQGPWDEEKEEYGPTPWDKCYDLYALLDGLCDDIGER